MIKEIFTKTAWNAASAVRRGMTRGILHAAGSEPVRRLDDGTDIFRFFGKAFHFGGDDIAKRMPGLDEAAGVGTILMTAGMTVASGGMLVQGYQENGLLGVAQTASWEIAVGSALATHGYKWQNGVAKTGGIFRRGGFLNHAGRAALGSTAGYMVGTGIGGPLGYVAGGAAAYGATAMGGPILAAAAVGAGAATIGYGASQVIKAGHSFQQRKKNIHTSGDLAAFNTRGAFTMRQRAVQAMHKSHLNARSALGREANFMHYPSKNYHSRYRA